MDTRKIDKSAKAKKKVEALKGFYIHLTLYFLINTMLLVVKIIGTPYYGENFMGPIWHFSTFATWLIWGLGLAFHASKVFGWNPFFNKEWEKRQINKYMEKNKKESEKYK
ncbi:2TM domain-containing protein [Maribacter algarum]|uniref:2TM domain-containing protein n=1 Tax=Maribacter algarum (ex Zhang et al. 2020) TaxID=2578118 RepID=A0A5S3PQG1_9FLAO|nr:2TM domain-containing protein [Maribacter algarum]TMM56869.1 2TM domain-containing protein [Maribacter algarum]